MFFTPTPHYVVPTTMIDVIKHLGLQTSLTWVVDASDINSVSVGSNQTLGVLPAGGPTFTLGPTTAVDFDTDAQHVGVPGRQSSGEYWNTKVNAAATATQRLETTRATWSDNAHKNNALFTFAGWFWVSASATSANFFDTRGAETAVGALMAMSFTSTNNKLNLAVGNGSAAILFAPANSLTVPRDTPFFAAWSQDEAANNLLIACNADQEAVASAYSSPSASQSARQPRVHNATLDPVNTNGRVYNAAWWDRALSGPELTDLYDATKAKFGI